MSDRPSEGRATPGGIQSRVYVMLRDTERELAECKEALEKIANWDGPEEYLDDVEVELKAIARQALDRGVS